MQGFQVGVTGVDVAIEAQVGTSLRLRSGAGDKQSEDRKDGTQYTESHATSVRCANPTMAPGFRHWPGNSVLVSPPKALEFALACEYSASHY